MKAKIDLEKFICSYVKWNNIQDALKDQGLKCWNGEIVEIPQESEDERIRKAQLDYWCSIGGKEWLEKQGKSNPYSGVSFEYNGNIWGMCARDNGVDIGLNGELIQHVSIKKQGEQKPKWSKEDDYNVRCCIAKAESDIADGYSGRNKELIDWLKSLKQRMEEQR